MMNEIVPFLWFDGDAEEAVNLYVSLFPDSRIVDERRAEGGPDGPVFSIRFELMGRPYVAFNGGPEFRFNESISLFVDCQDQQEVDRLWEALSQGGQPSQCGWLKDRFGLSRQIIPQALGEMLYDPDPEKARRVMQAMLKMGKIEVEELRRAYSGQ
jgi:predicted 3-demethylubiquinone-9 3-methyltransferase (glyoxalase superfamily)